MRFVTLSIVIFLALAAIEAAPKSSLDSGYSPYEDVLIGQKRNFGVLQLGGGYGVAKRAQSSKYETKSEKHRRGPLNGLIPGGAFGRAARSCIKINCHPSEKLIKLLKDRLENQYFSFDVDSDRQATKDGQVKTPIGVYKTYQLMEIE